MSDVVEVTVLIVEDEVELADTYARWLDPPYTAHTATTGEQALESLERHEVDVVLLDRRLPGLSGQDVLERIRDRGVDCRVAMLTAVDPEYDILTMGFDDYVTKPVLEDELRDLVDRLSSLDTVQPILQESYALAAKLGRLKEETSRSDRRDHDEYQRLRERFEELQGRIDDRFADLPVDDFARAYQELVVDGESE